MISDIIQNILCHFELYKSDVLSIDGYEIKPTLKNVGDALSCSVIYSAKIWFFMWK